MVSPGRRSRFRPLDFDDEDAFWEFGEFLEDEVGLDEIDIDDMDDSNIKIFSITDINSNTKSSGFLNSNF